MSIVKVFAFVAIFLVLTSTNGQRPDNCYCGDRADFSIPCDTPGCSTGDNPTCGDLNRYAFHAGPLPKPGARGAVYYRACSCPGYSYGGRPADGFYDASSVYYGNLYNFTNCAGFGNNARLRDGNLTPYIDDAVKCCDYCCASSTSTAATRTSTAVTTPSTTSVTQTYTLVNTTSRVGAEVYLSLWWIVYFSHQLTTFTSKRATCKDI